MTETIEQLAKRVDNLSAYFSIIIDYLRTESYIRTKDISKNEGLKAVFDFHERLIHEKEIIP